MINWTGVYVNFEGPECSGKSTQIVLLGKYLNSRFPDQELLITREPGGDVVSEYVRGVLLTPDFKGIIRPKTEVYGFAMARAQSLETTVAPVLFRGGNVLSDRGLGSSLAYQGIVRGFGICEVIAVNNLAVRQIIPDRIIYMKLPAEEVIRRVRERQKYKSDRLDEEGEEFHRQCVRAYDYLAERFSSWIWTVDGMLPIGKIAEQIQNETLRLISEKEGRTGKEGVVIKGERE